MMNTTRTLQQIAMAWIFGMSTAVVMPVQAAESTANSSNEQTELVPVVRVEIKQPKGAVIKSAAERMTWDEASVVRLSKGKRTHDVTLTINRKDEQGSHLSVTMSYEVDGELVIEDFNFDTRAKKREVLRTDDGIALAITVTPKQLKTGSASNEREDKLGPTGDPNDPLAGL